MLLPATMAALVFVGLAPRATGSAMDPTTEIEALITAVMTPSGPELCGTGPGQKDVARAARARLIAYGEAVVPLIARRLGPLPNPRQEGELGTAGPGGSALMSVLVELGSAPAWQLLEQRLKGGGQDERAWALRAIASRRPQTPRTLQAFLAAAQSSDSKLRAAALDVVSELGPIVAADDRRALLAAARAAALEPIPEARASAATALGALAPDGEALKTLVLLLAPSQVAEGEVPGGSLAPSREDRLKLVRVHAVFAVEKFGPAGKDAGGALESVARDARAAIDLRIIALRAIKAVDPERLSTLKELVRKIAADKTLHLTTRQTAAALVGETVR